MAMRACPCESLSASRGDGSGIGADHLLSELGIRCRQVVEPDEYFSPRTKGAARSVGPRVRAGIVLVPL